MNFAQITTATPTQLRFHQERMERMARLQGASLTPKPKVRMLPIPPPKPVTVGWFPYYRAAPWDSWDCEIPIMQATSWRKIVSQVCVKHGVTFEEIVGQARSKRIVRARQEAYFRLREERQISWAQIGKMLGGKDHTSVLYGWRMHQAKLAVQ